MSFDQDTAVQRVMELMAIPGDSGREADVADYLIGHLRAAGAKASWISSDQVQKRTPLQGNTGNLVCVLPGTVRGPRRLLMAHSFTMPSLLPTNTSLEFLAWPSHNPSSHCVATLVGYSLICWSGQTYRKLEDGEW